MLRNYFTVVFRTFSRQKGYTLINIAGLAIGLAGALLICAYILDELTYDTVHPFTKNTYRIGTHFIPEDGSERTLTSVPPIWSSQLKEQYPDVQAILRTLWMGYPYSINYKDKDRIVLTEELFFVDKNFGGVMYFDVTGGDRATALSEVNSIALSESAAGKIFGTEDPIGKILTVKHIFATSGKELDLMVTAVFKDYPSNTNFKPSCLVPMESLRSVIEWANYDEIFTGWLSGWMDSYVVLRDGADPEYMGNELERLVSENQKSENYKFIPFLRRITDLHFDDEVKWYNEGTGDLKNLHILVFIAVFLILIASINYMNLATARSSRRSREVGMRKVMGSSRRQLIFQFLTESFSTVLLSLLLCLLVISMVLPVFNALAQKNFAFGTFFNPRLLGGTVLILILVSLLAGSYPSFYLSGFRPAEVLKGGRLKMKGSDAVRTILVSFQFSISLLMLICSGVLMEQIHLMKSSKLNEQGRQMLAIRYGGGTAPIAKYPEYKHAVLQDARFSEVTMGNHLPRLDYFGYIGVAIRAPELGDQDYDWKELRGDYNFPEVFNLELLAGRDFMYGNPADSDACLINEAAARNLGTGLADAVGLTLEDSRSGQLSNVIGVVRDFPYESIHQPIGPLRICARLHPNDQILYVKLPAKDMQDCIRTLETKWKEVFPGIGFDYWFLDDEFGRMYESEIRMSGLSESFTVIAILLACLGLIGLASYMTEQRTGEISIRKVLGSSVNQILGLFLRTFLKMLVISSVISVPLAYLAMHKWLQQFVYRTSVDWRIIIGAIAIVFGITILTTGYELIRAANTNPVKALRQE